VTPERRATRDRADAARKRYFATFRIATGTCEGIGEIIDRETGKCVWCCATDHHRHPYMRRSDRHPHRSGAARAKKCADKQLRKMIAQGTLYDPR
jgi:hypothetical protein